MGRRCGMGHLRLPPAPPSSKNVTRESTKRLRAILVLKITQTHMEGILVVEPTVFGDERGFFLESYNEREFSRLGLPTHFVQDNHSGSRMGVLRGLHYQLHKPQGKLVRVLMGEVFDVAVDLRYSSPTFGHWYGLRLSSENRQMLWVPPGFGHGFLVLSDFAEISYKATELYAPAHERVLLWNDPALGIDWPLTGEPILSAKDKAGVPLAEAEVYEHVPVVATH